MDYGTRLETGRPREGSRGSNPLLSTKYLKIWRIQSGLVPMPASNTGDPMGSRFDSSILRFLITE